MNCSEDKYDAQILKFQEYQVTHSRELLNELIEMNIGLVYSMIEGLGWEEYQHELFTYGLEGLMIAVERFEPRLGKQFSTYGSYYIQEEIIKGICDIHHCPRSVFYYEFICNKRLVELQQKHEFRDYPEMINLIFERMVRFGKSTCEQNERHRDKLLFIFCDSLDHGKYSQLLDDQFWDRHLCTLMLQEEAQFALELVETYGASADRNGKIMKCWYGFDDGHEKTYSCVKECLDLNITIERIRQIIKTCLICLKRDLSIYGREVCELLAWCDRCQFDPKLPYPVKDVTDVKKIKSKKMNNNSTF